MQNTEFITMPITAKAIQFLPDGSNYDEVIAVVKLNGGHAELTYVDKNQQPVAPNTITEHRAILLFVNRQSAVIVTKGNYIILNSDEKYPVPEKDFKTFYLPLSEVNQIGNGQHTMQQLYDEIERLKERLLIYGDKDGK